jgi:hypothetical protein
MRPKTLLAPQPRHLGPIPMPKLRILIAFKTIWCSLKRRRYEQILSRYQILRMYLLNQYLRWDQRKPYLLENILQFVNLFFGKFAILQFELLFIGKIEIAISSGPSQTG